MKNVISAVCIKCGAEYEATPTTYTCKKCEGILDIKFDYKYIKNSLNKEKLSARKENTIWRYKEFLPIKEDSPIPPLRIGGSPLYKAKRLGKELGINGLYIKDDGQNPTSSLKDRASAIAVVKAIEAGKDTVACSSTGNAASSLAGSCASLGLKSYIFVPQRAPMGKVAQLLIFGANVISVLGNYEDTFRLSAQAIEKWGWYNRNAAINPYLVEGKKTVSLEIAEQMGFKTPDYIFVSVGDGCTIAGVWKGFVDLYETGFIDKLPKIISVQSSGCYPINKAFTENNPLEPMEENTIADSIAVGVPRNPDKAIKAIKDSGGFCINVSDEEILDAMKLLGQTTGVFGEPAGVTATAGLKAASEKGLIDKNAIIVSIVTGNGLKDVQNAISAAGVPIKIPPEMSELISALNIKEVNI